MSNFVKVKFLKNYSASRGPAISGAKGDEKEIRMTDALKECLDSGVCELVKAAKAEKRETATRKKTEKS